MKPTADKDGYLIVGLYKNGQQTKHKVHRLVALSFIHNPRPDVFNQINHLDENKQNNRVENLEWCDSKYNVNYGNRNNLVSIAIHNNEHIKKIRKPILRCDMNGNVIKRYNSSREAANDGFNRGCIMCACKHKIRHHKGFVWIYESEYKGGETV